MADVTIINDPTNERATPNPNVLLELGYAMHALGEERIILVMNSHYGPVERLPFDLRARRTIIYNVDHEAAEKATERHRLAGILTSAIKAAIDTIPQTPPEPDKIDSAIIAIENVASNRALLIRNAMKAITTELEQVAPPLFLNRATTDELLAAIKNTIPAVQKFTRLSDATATMNDTNAARTLYKPLTPILEHYDNPKGFSGRYDERDFDYWKFLGHELLVTLTARLLTEERYEIINDILDEPLTITNARYANGKPVDHTYASQWLHSFRSEHSTNNSERSRTTATSSQNDTTDHSQTRSHSKRSPTPTTSSSSAENSPPNKPKQAGAHGYHGPACTSARHRTSSTTQREQQSPHASRPRSEHQTSRHSKHDSKSDERKSRKYGAKVADTTASPSPMNKSN
ncbi:MAG: hypothetical protein ACSLE8_17775 [Rhodococcus sp. (in: high G+C Gram-positive bacteria)]